MKKLTAATTVILILAVLITGCSAGNSAGGERPVFPAMINAEAIIKQGDEEYAVKITRENGATELTVLEPPEISGLKIKIDNGTKSFFLGGMTVTDKIHTLPNNFADDFTGALDALQAKGVAVRETAGNSICVYDGTTDKAGEIPLPVYKATFDESGALTALEAPGKGLTAVFG